MALDENPMTKNNDSAVESADQDQTVCRCRPILLPILSKTNRCRWLSAILF